jgi:class 3 adenylate cyclase/TolB-like protein
MAMTETKRRLAAIMFTDIAGYTAMMGSDEDKAIELLHYNRSLQKPLIEQHGGKWLKEMGDGVLASFSSAYHAVKCAIEIQQTANEDLKNKIRIGIHLGDVTIEDEDVFGDGVNIASRLEAIADPGAIYVSEAVYNATRANKEITFQYLGELHLKNVENKIGTYALSGEGLILPTRNKIKELSKAGTKISIFHQSILFYIILVSSLLIGSWLLWSRLSLGKTVGIQSLAVLPFTNYTGDEDQAYLVAGMHDALISELGRLGGIRVIAKQSTLQYTNSQKTIQELASELNVDALIVASVFKENENIKVQIKLIKAFPEEQQLWSQSFDSNMSDILNLYSVMTKNIASEIKLSVSPDQQARLNESRAVNPEAYNAYLQGRFYWYKFTREDLEISKQYFEKAIEVDPDYALGYVGYADVISTMAHVGHVAPGMRYAQAKDALLKALTLEPELAEAHDLLARIRFAIDWEWEDSEKEFIRAIEINPNLGDARIVYSQFLTMMGRFDEAIKETQYCTELNPLHPWFQAQHAMRLFYARHYQESANKFQELLTNFPDYFEGHLSYADVLYKNGSYRKSLEESFKAYSIANDSVIVEILKDRITTTSSRADYERVLKTIADTLSFRSKNTYVKPSEIARSYIKAGEKQEALKWLNKAFEERDSQLVYVINNPVFESIIEDTLFLDIIKKMNLNDEILYIR